MIDSYADGTARSGDDHGRISDIVIREESARSEAVRWCFGRHYEELRRRFGHVADEALPLALDELTPPRGLVLIAREHGEPVGCGTLKLGQPGIGEAAGRLARDYPRLAGHETRSHHPHRSPQMSTAPTIVDLRAPVDTPSDGIVSRAIYSDDDVRVVLFSFAPGQQLSDHTAPMPATLEVVDGEADITLGDDRVAGQPGTWIHMPANTPHSVVARTPVTLLLHLLKRSSEAR